MADAAGSELRVIRAADGIGVGELDNVCLVVWRLEVTRPRFEAQRAALAEIAGKNDSGAGFFCVIEPTAGPPDDELRRASAKMISTHQSRLRAIACVVEGTGFRNAVSRSALSGIALLIGRRSMPFSVFGTVDDASAWMAPKVGSLRPTSLSSRVEHLRSLLAPAPS